ncbi:MAG: glycosyl transferase, partial [Nitrospirota bacterium]|nr:glycosyl transferase [Nitrospirota bacterium]
MNFFTPKNMVLIIGDFIISIMSVYAGVYLRLYGNYAPLREYDPILPKAMVFSLLIVLMCFFVDLYSAESRDGRKEIIMKIIIAGVISFIGIGAFYYFVPYLQLGRGILFIALSISILFLSIWHIGYGLLLRMPVAAKRILILGTGPAANAMGKLLVSNGNGFALSGYINCIGEPIHVPSDTVIGNGEGLLDIALREKVQKIVVSLSERRGTLPVREMLNCKLQGIDVVDGPSFYEQITGKLLIENMNPSHLIFSDGFRITSLRRYLKRIIDVFF